MKTLTQINTSTIVRKFPEWARVDRVINGVEIYNMNIFDNIMTFNQDNLDGDAFEVCKCAELVDVEHRYKDVIAGIGVAHLYLVS